MPLTTLTSSSPAHREDNLQRDPLGEYLVWWNEFSEEHLEAFRKRLSTAANERDLQRFFSKNPMLLARLLGGGHGRWVIPHQRMKVQMMTDFVIGGMSSDRFEWFAVELESPKARSFTRSRDPGRQLNHAIQQVQDWRAWLQRNLNYAARGREEGGLGLTDIVPRLPGLILIGRRSEFLQGSREPRLEMIADLNINIHTYDWLLESVNGWSNP